MSRPSDEFDETELRDEFDWMHEFMSRMAERITNDPDVHNLADYVRKIEDENTQLKRKLKILKEHGVEIVDAVSGGYEIYNDDHARADKLQAENARLRSCLSDDAENAKAIMGENAKLRKLVRDMWSAFCFVMEGGIMTRDPGNFLEQRMRDLGIEEDA